MPDPPNPPRRRGRPPLAIDDPSVTFTVRVPTTEFDTTWAKARAARVLMARIVDPAKRFGDGTLAPQ